MRVESISQEPTRSAGSALAGFQDAFAGALLTPDAHGAENIAALITQPAFAVYRNTVMKGCIDALQANYPTIARLVGEEWFRAAAAIFVRESPPLTPMLLEYGHGFAEFLERFAPAADLPYLPGVARLDRCWTQAHIAADATPLDPATVAEISPQLLARTRLHPHPAAHWQWFNDAPIYAIWSRNRISADPAAELAWRAEGALLTRPHGEVTWHELDSAGCAFLDACAAGKTLAAAADAALTAKGTTDLSRLMKQLLVAGAFGGLSLVNDL